jgi:hypothetical protein
VFRGHNRRSGSKRSIWHNRERKRLPLAERPVAPVAPPPPVRARYVPTEAKWNSDQPGTMLRCFANLALQNGTAFHLSRAAIRRKYRLFYCACCRLRWSLLPVLARQVVETVERCADGLGNAKLLREARRTAEAVERAAQPVPHADGYDPSQWEVAHAVRLAGAAAASHVRLRLGVSWSAWSVWPVSVADQVALLRELFGNPFQPVEIEPAWLTSTVQTLAHRVRTERAFELMPVLGDALQDAGCARAEVLEHCYGTGPHSLGCWLVDSLSGW